MPEPARPRPVRILLLGGTGEAFRLAVAAADHARVEVTSSLAGRTRRPRLPPGRIRIGGFGGAAGLEAHLRRSATDAVVDATHPFARRISAHARAACAAAGRPLLVLDRPATPESEGTLTAADLGEALRLLGPAAGRVLVAFAPPGPDPLPPVRGIRVLFRSLEVPKRLPEGSAWTPFDPRRPVEAERQFLNDLRIGAIVAKASGGEVAAAKLAAAAGRELPVVLLRRPETPMSPAAGLDPAAAGAQGLDLQVEQDQPRPARVYDVDAALAWMLNQRAVDAVRRR